MAQDDAPMSTFWFQVLVTLVAAGVRNQPRIEHRISLFTAVAFISMEKFTVSFFFKCWMRLFGPYMFK